MFNALLAVAAVVAALAALTTAWPKIPLSAMWQGKEASFQELVHLRPLSSVGFVFLALYAAAAAWAWHRRLRLGWRLVAFGLLGNLAADVTTTIATRQPSHLIAVVLDGAVATWVLLPGTRRRFGRHAGGRAPLLRAGSGSGTG